MDQEVESLCDHEEGPGTGNPAGSLLEVVDGPVAKVVGRGVEGVGDLVLKMKNKNMLGTVGTTINGDTKYLMPVVNLNNTL